LRLRALLEAATMNEMSNRLKPSEIAIGDEGPPAIVENIDREDFVRYAGASGDFNPIHYNEPYAKEHGHESVFAQGMFTAGIASRFVTDWLGIGELASFSTRFVAQAWPGDTLEVTGEVVDIQRSKSNTLVEIEFIVRANDDRTVLIGTAAGRYTSGSIGTDE
jgi:peroxisomal enoyl-CoA hydratase 2